MSPPSRNKVAAFLAANRKSPVVYGSVIGRGGRGCYFRLADGTTWRLTAKELEVVGHPRWAFEDAA